MRTASRNTVLNEIFECFQQITQWIPDNFDRAAEYQYKAEALIELLEVKDCGSVGGYDPDSPVKHTCGYNLYNRFMALVNKYNSRKHIKAVCGFTLDKMEKYFSEIKNQRTKILGEE